MKAHLCFLMLLSNGFLYGQGDLLYPVPSNDSTFDTNGQLISVVKYARYEQADEEDDFFFVHRREQSICLMEYYDACGHLRKTAYFYLIPTSWVVLPTMCLSPDLDKEYTYEDLMPASQPVVQLEKTVMMYTVRTLPFEGCLLPWEAPAEDFGPAIAYLEQVAPGPFVDLDEWYPGYPSQIATKPTLLAGYPPPWLKAELLPPTLERPWRKGSR